MYLLTYLELPSRSKILNAAALHGELVLEAARVAVLLAY